MFLSCSLTHIVIQKSPWAVPPKLVHTRFFDIKPRNESRTKSNEVLTLLRFFECVGPAYLQLFFVANLVISQYHLNFVESFRARHTAHNQTCMSSLSARNWFAFWFAASIRSKIRFGTLQYFYNTTLLFGMGDDLLMI